MPRHQIGRFADYFVVCGLDETAPLETCRFGSPGGIWQDDPDIDLKERVSPLQRNYKAKVLCYYPYDGELDTSAVVMLCFPQGLSFYDCPQDDAFFHPFIITREDGSKLHAAALIFYEKVSDNAIIQSMNSQCRDFHRQLQKASGRLATYRPFADLYVSKCICLVLPQPFNRAAEIVLRHIYQTATHESDLPVESYIYNILYEVPLPPMGRSVRIFTGKKSVVCYRPGEAELPMVDYLFSQLIQLLGTENLISLFCCALLEQRILLKSSHFDRLMTVSECLSALLFPFCWAHVYVPILPSTLRHFLDAPVPFIMGLWQCSDGPVDDLELTCEMCLVDIDNGTVEPPEELPPFPNAAELKKAIDDLCQKYNIQRISEDNHEEGDSDSGMSSTDSSPNTHTDDKNDMQVLQQSAALAQIAEIAKRTGVISSLEDFQQQFTKETRQMNAASRREMLEREKQQQDLSQIKFSYCLREIFLNSLIQLFSSYEKFIIYPTQCDLTSWLSNREMMHNFDKETFLGDQPAMFQRFFCPFLETQMFASFIDHKIMSQWQDPDPSVRVFDMRNQVKLEEEDNQKAVYENCANLTDVEALVDKHMSSVDYVALSPHALEGLEPTSRHPHVFPGLNSQVLNRGYSRARTEESDSSSSDGRSRRNSDRPDLDLANKLLLNRQTSLALDANPENVSEAYLKFVHSLLKECKTKTKRMLVCKMGQEAVELGHTDPTLMGLEENTMIASLCDLLERIWNHGLSLKQSKSPLWAHLTSYAELSEMTERNNMVDTFKPKEESAFTAALISAGLKLLQDLNVATFMPSDAEKHLQLSRVRGTYTDKPPGLSPSTSDLVSDIKHVNAMQEIKTDVGRARAFIRLALEKVVLAKHLKELLSNTELLKSLYKRVAFLRCEDEREQALCHLLSLNAADYHCFTNAFPNSLISYRVVILPGKRFAGGLSTTTANVWISVAGKLKDSDRKWLPRNILDFTFESKNLGIPSTVRIGHDNSGMAPKWLVDSVLVRNETTGQVVRFPCGRWLGRGVDDDSTERILVGDIVPRSQNFESLLDTVHGSPKRQTVSPKLPRHPTDFRKSKTQIQQSLTDSINNLLKYSHKAEKERGSVTVLLCGDQGLVTHLEAMLSLGFKSTRFFRNNLYIWDYLERVLLYLKDNNFERCRSLDLISIINNSLQDVGKDGKLQLLLCLGVRDHLLPDWLTYLHDCPITSQMYEESSFLLDDAQVQFLVNMLRMLRSYHIDLEPSITKGLDI